MPAGRRGWSAVFLTSVRNVDASYAGLGYAAFASIMTIGRLSGDKIVHRFGNAKILEVAKELDIKLLNVINLADQCLH